MSLALWVCMFAQAGAASPAQLARDEGIRATQEGKFEIAEPAFAKACRLDPKLPSACYFHGRVLYYLNRFDEALAELQKALDAGERGGRVYSTRAQCLEALGRTQEAEDEHRKAIAGPPDAQFLTRYGLFLYHQGRAADSLEPLTRATALAPEDFEAQLVLGRALLELGKAGDALGHLESAVRGRPNSSQAHLLAAKACQRLGYAERAKAHLQAIQAPEP